MYNKNKTNDDNFFVYRANARKRWNTSKLNATQLTKSRDWKNHMQTICKTTGNTCFPRLSKRSLVFSLFILCFSVDTSRWKCVQIVTNGPRRFQRRNDEFPFNFWNNAADNKITVVPTRFVDEVLQTKEGYRGTSKGPPVLAPFRSLSTPSPSWNSCPVAITNFAHLLFSLRWDLTGAIVTGSSRPRWISLFQTTAVNFQHVAHARRIRTSDEAEIISHAIRGFARVVGRTRYAVWLFKRRHWRVRIC